MKARWIGSLFRVMLALLALCSGLAYPADLQIGQPAPKLDTKLAHGGTLSERHLDGKVVLQYFWATWCPVCRSDLPQLQKLYEAHKPHGLEIVAQSLDDDRSVVIKFWERTGYTFPVAMRSDETRTAFGPIKGTPTLFLIDRGGVLRLKHLGMLPAGTLEAKIEALLKQ